MADKRLESSKPVDPKKLDALIQKIIELANTYGDNLDIIHIANVLDIVCAFDDIFVKGTSQSEVL
jgi:hypothetical protein